MPSHRLVKLLDNRVPERPLISALLYRGLFAGVLDDAEASWAPARDALTEKRQDLGLARPEHAHWDWRTKADTVEAGQHVLVGIELEGIIQGLMAVLQHPRSARLGDRPLVYIDYLESAPWNIKGSAHNGPRFLGVGTVLIAEAVRISIDLGCDGRVGLHSLPQAEEFYEKRCKMTRVGADPGYYDLAYFEYPDDRGIRFLESIGESL